MSVVFSLKELSLGFLVLSPLDVAALHCIAFHSILFHSKTEKGPLRLENVLSRWFYDEMGQVR